MCVTTITETDAALFYTFARQRFVLSFLYVRVILYISDIADGFSLVETLFFVAGTAANQSEVLLLVFASQREEFNADVTPFAWRRCGFLNMANAFDYMWPTRSASLLAHFFAVGWPKKGSRASSLYLCAVFLVFFFLVGE